MKILRNFAELLMQKIASFLQVLPFWESNICPSSARYGPHRGDTCPIKQRRLKSAGSDNLITVLTFPGPKKDQRGRWQRFLTLWSKRGIFGLSTLLALWVSFCESVVEITHENPKWGAYAFKVFVYIENGEHAAYIFVSFGQFFSFSV